MAITIGSIFPLLTTTISFLFFISVLEQYRRKRSAHQLVWSIAMFLFMLTAGMEGLSFIIGEWIPSIYRLYYVLAAFQVSIMGAGVLYLFDSRNVINERNTSKQFILFGLVWGLFSFIFFARNKLFLLILLPAVLILGLGLIYHFFILFDKLRFRGDAAYLCRYCRVEYTEPVKICNTCTNDTIDFVTPAGRYRTIWHRRITGRFFSHLFVLFSMYIFFLMNTIAWTAPLHEGLLVTGKEVSGLPWQLDPFDSSEPRASVRLFSPFFTVPGVITLVGGGFYSYITWQFSIRRNQGSFKFSTGFFNVWIALGALVLGQGGFLSGLGKNVGQNLGLLYPDLAGIGFLYVSEVISVAMMYWGFLGSDKLSKEKLFSLISFKTGGISKSTLL